MLDLIFYGGMGIAILIALHMLLRPDVHARANPKLGTVQAVRTRAIVIVVIGIAVVLLRTFLV